MPEEYASKAQTRPETPAFFQYPLSSPLKVVNEFFEVKFKVWLTSIGPKEKMSSKETNKNGKLISKGKNLIKRNRKGLNVGRGIKQGFRNVK